MGSATLVHNFTGETLYIICVPKKTTAPLADVICTINGVPAQTRIVYPAAHGQESVLFEGLDPVWYFFTFYRSVDGVALTEQVNIIAFNVATGASYPALKFDYVVNRGDFETDVWADPVTDDTELNDTRLAGAIKLIIFERGTGPMLDNAFTVKLTGGWDWTESKVFTEDGVYSVLAIFKVNAVPVTTTGAGGGYDGVIILDSNIVYNPVTHNNKILYVTDATSLTFPNFSALANCKSVIQTHALSGLNIKLLLDTGDTVKFRGEDFNIFILGRGEVLEFYVLENQMYVFDYEGDYARVGTRELCSLMPLNGLGLDGTQYIQTNVPRLMWFIDKLPAGAVVSEGTGVGQWAEAITDTDTTGKTGTGLVYYPQKNKYARDDGAGTIRVPDDRRIFYGASVLITDVPGIYEFQKVGRHFHSSGTEAANDVKYKRGLLNILRRFWNTSNNSASDAKNTTDMNPNDLGINVPSNTKLIPCVII